MLRQSSIYLILSSLILFACQPAAQNNGHSASSPATTSNHAIVQPKGVDVHKDNIGGDFTLTNGDGKPFQLSSLKGKVVVLSFGFTNCPDVCPTELLNYSDAMKKLGDQAKDVAVVFVSVDPERDTPDLIGRYTKQFHKDFIGLTDTNKGADIAIIKKQYRITSAKTEIKSETLYNIDHTSGAYLIDKKGKVVLFEPYGTDSKNLADDIQKLLAE